MEDQKIQMTYISKEQFRKAASKATSDVMEDFMQTTGAKAVDATILMLTSIPLFSALEKILFPDSEESATETTDEGAAE